MTQRYRVTRHVTPAECDWLRKPVLKGTIVYAFRGPTYGCVNTSTGMAVSAEPNATPFFELPLTALEFCGSDEAVTP